MIYVNNFRIESFSLNGQSEDGTATYVSLAFVNDNFDRISLSAKFPQEKAYELLANIKNYYRLTFYPNDNDGMVFNSYGVNNHGDVSINYHHPNDDNVKDGIIDCSITLNGTSKFDELCYKINMSFNAQE